MTVKNLRAVSGGKDRLIGFWRSPENGNFANLYAIAREARNHVEGLQIAYQNINADQRLSDLAKREDGQKSAKERLYFIGELQRRLDVEKAQIQERVSKLSAVKPYRDGDASTVQIDLALATQLREMTAERRNSLLRMGTEKAYIDAALRLPRQLLGLSEEWYATCVKAAIARLHPQEAQELEELMIAAEDAQSTVKNAFSIIARDGSISLNDRVDAAGGSAKDLVSGVNEDTIEHIQDREDEEDESEDEEDGRMMGV